MTALTRLCWNHLDIFPWHWSCTSYLAVRAHKMFSSYETESCNLIRAPQLAYLTPLLKHSSRCGFLTHREAVSGGPSHTNTNLQSSISELKSIWFPSNPPYRKKNKARSREKKTEPSSHWLQNKVNRTNTDKSEMTSWNEYYRWRHLLTVPTVITSEYRGSWCVQ